MATRHIIMADPNGLAEYLKPVLTKINDTLELVSVPDGARCITAHAKLCRAKLAPLIVVLWEHLEHVNGAQVAVAIRKIESSLGANNSAIIYVTDKDDQEGRTREWGRAVSLTRKDTENPKEEAHRVARAIAKVLSQLTKRGRK